MAPFTGMRKTVEGLVWMGGIQSLILDMLNLK